MMKKRVCKKAYKHLHKFCFFCGEDDYAALQCHRIISGGVYAAHNVLTVCASCHCKIHSGFIKIDRKYQQMSPLFKVHYWINNEEYWRDEEIGFFIEPPKDYHIGLGKSAKLTNPEKKKDTS